MSSNGESAQTVWEKNLAVLQKNDPRQAHSLRECDRRFRARAYRIFETEDGGVDVRCPSETGETFQMYTGKPVEVINELVEKWNVTSTPGECLVVVGFGLSGHLSRLLRQMHPTGKLVVVEPDPLLFYSAFRNIDITDILSDRRVSFVVGLRPQQAVESIGKQCGWVRLCVLPVRMLLHPPTTQLRPSYVQQFRNAWVDALSREEMYRSSKCESGEEVVRHTVENFSYLIREPGIRSLFGRFNGIPAIQAAAGPSLNDSLQDLMQLQKKALITCVNTAYKVIRSEGIEPDLIFCLDHHERNWLSFEGDEPSSNTFLVADPRIDPRIVRLFAGRVFFISWHTTTETIGSPCPIDSVPLPKHGGNAVYKWFQTVIGDKGTVTATGSVAVAAFQILARMGCRPIVLIGQDLAFPGSRLYAEGTVFDDSNLPRDSNATRFVPATDGGQVGTSETLNLYRVLLEHEIKRFDIPVVNSSIGGAMIAGSRVAPLSDLPFHPAQMAPDADETLRALHDESLPDNDAQSVRAEIATARKALYEFMEDVRNRLNRFDARIAEPTDEGANSAEQDLETVIKENPFAFDLLNDLLQEPHILYEEARCKVEIEETLDQRNRLRIESVRKVLEAFQERSAFLRSLLAEAEPLSQ